MKRIFLSIAIIVTMISGYVGIDRGLLKAADAISATLSVLTIIAWMVWIITAMKEAQVPKQFLKGICIFCGMILISMTAGVLLMNQFTDLLMILVLFVSPPFLGLQAFFGSGCQQWLYQLQDAYGEQAAYGISLLLVALPYMIFMATAFYGYKRREDQSNGKNKEI